MKGTISVLRAVEQEIQRQINSLGSREVSRLYSKLPPGKRLRARLIITIAGSTPRTIKTAAVVEMIHAASLLHDDVIDEAMLRRSRPSLNALYGNKAAIMLGDILYSKGYAQLAQMDRKLAHIIATAVTHLSIGELNDVMLSERFNTNEEAYFEMIYQKTGALIEAAAHAAAYLANKPIDPYRRYGRNLGIAFQIVDDILDVTASKEVLGKPAMHDFQEGKTTLPYLYLYRSLKHLDQKKLLGFFGKKLHAHQVQWIQEQMALHGVIQKCQGVAKALIHEAITLMQDLQEEALEQIAKAMIEREF